MTQKILVTVDSTQIIPTMGSLNGMEVSNGGITVSNDSFSTVLTYMSIGDSSDVDSTMIESMLFMNFDFFSLFAIIFGIDIGIENPMIITIDSGYVTAADLSDTTGGYYSGTYMAPLDTNQVNVDMENFTFSFDTREELHKGYNGYELIVNKCNNNKKEDKHIQKEDKISMLGFIRLSNKLQHSK